MKIAMTRTVLAKPISALKEKLYERPLAKHTLLLPTDG